MPGLGGRAQVAVRGLHRDEAGGAGARLRRPAALLGGNARRPGHRRAGGIGLRPRADRRVSGHQPPAGRDPRRPEARRPRRHRGRRRRAGDLRLPRRGGAQHPRLPGSVRAPGTDRHPRAQLPLDPADPGGGERGDRRGARALRQDALDRAPRRAHRRCSSPSSTRRRRPTTCAPRCWRRARRGPP